MTWDNSQHPCFSDTARHRFARIHLPIAPDCNVQCNFCRRDCDCVNESRPGVTSTILTPQQALHYLGRVLELDPRITVVGIAGPGDPFATPDKTLETLRLVRERYPELLLCLASNGLNVAPYADVLADLAVSHVTVTVNAIDPEIGAKVYAWIRDGKRMHRGRPGAELLWERQAAAIRELKRRNVTVKINTIIIPGVNDHHVADVARCAAGLGVDIANCVPLYPVADTPFADLPQPTGEQVAAIRAEVAQHLPIMQHCTRCRADAVGLLGEAMQPDVERYLRQAAALPLHPAESRPYVAVASLEGVLINQHLGEAEELSIYRQAEDGFDWVENRPAPPSGGGTQRWETLAESLHDCRALLVASAGQSPRSVLAARGIQLVMMEGLIDEGLDAVYRGVEVRGPLRKQHRCGSGSGCAGDGMGCS
ncbi:MAG: radical SAM protein [Planctomycetota bacterium]|nr:radical SAM protein [Planctomycetota bacterium]